MTTRTNIVLDDDLVAQAMARARVTTKKAAVEAALRAFVRRPDYTGLLALAGTGAIADDYDPKATFSAFADGNARPLQVAEAAPPWPPAKPVSRKATARKPASRRRA